MRKDARGRAAERAASARSRRKRRLIDAATAAAGGARPLPTLVDFSQATAAAKAVSRETPIHTVYIKERWADEWTEEPYLFCTEPVWGCAPSISTASILWHYGAIAQEQTSVFLTYVRRSLNRVLVKIVFQIDRDSNDGWNTWIWYGVIEIDEDRIGGALFELDPKSTPKDPIVNVQVAGAQVFVAYGLESLLSRHEIARSFWQDATLDPVTEIARGLVFNRDGKPNKHPEDRGGGLHAFGGLSTTNEYWSTVDILIHLLEYHAPQDVGDSTHIPFELAGTESLPDWDKPEVPTDGRTVYELLTSLIPRQRLLGFYCTVEEAELEVDDVVKINVFSFSPYAVPITLSGAASIPGNPNQIRIAFDEDPSALATLKKTTLGGINQVIIQGARRRSVCSLAYSDATLENGWAAADETAYEAGASGEGDYPAASEVKERRERNTEYRNRPELANVYSRFQIPDDWDLKAGDGTGGDLNAVFPQYDAAGEISSTPYPVYPTDLQIEQTLPLLVGVDYSADKVLDGTFDESDATEERRPLCAWYMPGTGRFRDVETIGASAYMEQEDSAENFKWSAHLSIPQGEAALRLRISGQPQHVIAYTDFSGQSEDESLGEHDYTDAIFTVALTDDRRCEGRFPADADLPDDVDYVRRLYIYAGERYQQNYVCPQTVVGIDGSGDLVYCNGGFVRDDTELLEQAAKVALLFYRDERRVLQLETARLHSGVGLGYMVSAIGSTKTPGQGNDLAVNSPITELRILSQLGDAETPPGPPTLRITTAAGELDPIRFLGQPFDLKEDKADESQTITTELEEPGAYYVRGKWVGNR